MRAWLLLLAMLLGAAPAGAQPAPPPDMTPAEAYIWRRLRAPLERPDFAVNLDDNCAGTQLDPREDDPRWRDPCRVVTAAFLERILTRDPWKGALPPRGVRLQAMAVQGVLDLSSLAIGVEVWMDRSRFLGAVVLTAARFEKSLTFDNSALLGGFAGDQLAVGNNLQLSGQARIGCLAEAPEPCGPMVLQAATIGGDLRLEGATIATVLSADDLTVGGSLHLTGATVDGGVLAGNLKVGRTLHLDEGVALGCRPAGGVCDALVLRNAEISGQLAMTGAVLRGNFQANSLKVHNHFQLRDAAVTHPDGARLNLRGAHVDGDLDLTASRLQVADLAGANIAGDLQLSTDNRPPPQWGANATLSLRNARAGAIQGSLDAERCPPAPGANLGDPIGHVWALIFGRNAQPAPAPTSAETVSCPWPASMELQGFVYDRLGGGSLDSISPMMARPSAELANWLARDRSFTRQPYQQLASVFTAAGDPNRATDILFAARYREELLYWKEGQLWDAAGLAALRVTIGYGLGNKFFRVLWWVGGFWVLGTLVLLASPAARRKGVLWSFGCSLDQLLPFVQLSPEFPAFFDDPGRERLKGWQVAFFALQSLVGFLLGGFVGAGLGGLTQAT